MKPEGQLSVTASITGFLQLRGFEVLFFPISWKEGVICHQWCQFSFIKFKIILHFVVHGVSKWVLCYSESFIGFDDRKLRDIHCCSNYLGPVNSRVPYYILHRLYQLTYSKSSSRETRPQSGWLGCRAFCIIKKCSVYNFAHFISSNSRKSTQQSCPQDLVKPKMSKH